MGWVIDVDIDTGDVIGRVDGLHDRVQGGLGADFAGPAISMEIAAIEREWFGSEGGATWPPLAPATLVARANRHGHYAKAPGVGVSPGGPILRWTNRLMHSLTDPRGAGASDAFIRMHPDEIEQGTMVPYAKYHVLNRPPIKPLTSEDLDRLREVMEQFILGEGEQ
jgi:hypothetical protein